MTRFLIPLALMSTATLVPILAYAQSEIGEATLTCPLDGEVITITTTPGCAFTGQTMDGRPVTTCPDDTLVPDCPASGLPLYKTFDQAERIALTNHLDSDLFDLLREDSRFERAFWLERRLRPDGPHNLALFILLDAYRDNPAVADTAMMKRLEATASRMAKDQPEDPATLMALANTAAWHAYADRPDDARKWLEKLGVTGATARGAAFLNLDTLRAADPESDTVTKAERAYQAIRDFSLYGDALKACLEDTRAEGCRADDPFEK